MGMKKCIAVLLIMVLMVSVLLGMSGCSSEEKEPLIGKWCCQLDLTEQIRQEFAADEETAEYLSLDSFVLTLEMEFKEDDTFTLRVDEKSVDAAIEGLLSCITEGMSRYLEDMMYEKTGLKMSAEEVLESMELTMEDLIAQMFPEESVEALREQVTSGFTKEGRFAVEEGKLFTSAGIDYDVDPEVYETYTLASDVLTILDYVGPEAPDEQLYPMVFKKVN